MDELRIHVLEMKCQLGHTWGIGMAKYWWWLSDSYCPVCGDPPTQLRSGEPAPLREVLTGDSFPVPTEKGLVRLVEFLKEGDEEKPPG